jgi:hypothetical protein
MTERAIVICDYVKIEGAVTEFARMRPILVANGNVWEPVPRAKLRERFPTAGTLFWHHPKSVRKDSAWVVSFSSSTSPGSSDRLDRFKVDDGQQLSLFVRRGVPTDEVALRRSIADSSLSFRVPYPGPVYVRVPSLPNRWVGPFPIDPTPQPDERFHINFSSTEGFAEVYEIQDAYLQPIDLFGQDAMTLAPGRSIGSPADAFNVQSDQHLLDASWKSLRKIDPTVAEGLKVTKSMYQKYVETLEQASLLGQSAIYARARIRALGQLFAGADKDFADASAIAESLLGWPAVASRLDAAIERRTTEMADDIRRSAEARERAGNSLAELAEAAHLAAKAKKERLDSQVKSLAAQVQTLKKELSGFEGRLDESIRAAGRTISKDPAQFLGHSILGQAILKATARNDTTSSLDVPLPDPPTPQMTISTPKQLGMASRLHAESAGIDVNAMLLAVGMLASDCPVVLLGAAASATSKLLSNVLAGGYYFAFPVPASVFGSTDVGGISAVESVTLKPIPIRFSEAMSRWVELGSPLLELSGADRAPLEIVLGDLASTRCARGAAPAGPRVVATLFKGPSTFKMSLNLRSQLAVVHCNWSAAIEGEPTPVPMSNTTLDIAESVVLATLPESVTQICLEVGIAPNLAAREIGMLAAIHGDNAMAIGNWASGRLSGLIESTRVSALIDSAAGPSISRSVFSDRSVREIQAAMYKE